MMESLPEALCRAVDNLFKVPLRDFVATRNQLSKRLRSEGFAEASLRVRSLGRPSLPAWALNQAYWFERSTFEAFLESSERLRQAQGQALGGAGRSGLREASRASQQRLNALIQVCQRLLKEADHAGGQSTLRSVQRSLEAILALGSDLPERLGRLTRDLKPPGFEALSGVAAQGGKAPKQPSTGKQTEAQRLLAQAESAVRALELESNRASLSAEAAADEETRAREGFDRLKTELQRLRSKVEVVESLVTAAEGKLADAGRRAEAASQAAARAAQELARAKSTLEALETIEFAPDRPV